MLDFKNDDAFRISFLVKFFRIYSWSEFLEVMTSSTIDNSERGDILSGNNGIKGFGDTNLEVQVQILDQMLKSVKGLFCSQQIKPWYDGRYIIIY